ncbi:MAG: transcriptional regulator [Gammaproteobacteria bacterium RIFCSPHIGHO2_12_FULL_42_13]|nr:MAG: transcriptional regulator [Gammaproteobacteria bacterium RIFCSPHIGHO2_12_FULL_42_13]
MTAQLTVRKSGGSTIISLPKVVLETLKLHVGSVMELSLENNRIVLTPINEPMNLEDLLRACPSKKFALTDEDLEWVHAKNKGKEM